MSQDHREARAPDAELQFDEELTYRWHGQLFTGTGFEEHPDGGLSEISYRYGVQEGSARDWYPSGRLQAESYFHDNVQHGASREYAEDGSLLMESFYEYGILVERRRRGSAGKVVTDFTLAQDSDAYDMLERYRRERGWPTSSWSGDCNRPT